MKGNVYDKKNDENKQKLQKFGEESCKMKKQMILVLGIITILTAAGCGKQESKDSQVGNMVSETEKTVEVESESMLESQEPMIEQKNDNFRENDASEIERAEQDEWGVALSAKNVTPTGITLVISRVGDKGLGEVITGEWYALEQKTEDGWNELEDIIEDKYGPMWHDIAWLIEENISRERGIDWEWLYGELVPGEYRIAKKIIASGADGDSVEKVYYAEFRIE